MEPLIANIVAIAATTQPIQSHCMSTTCLPIPATLPRRRLTNYGSKFRLPIAILKLDPLCTAHRPNVQHASLRTCLDEFNPRCLAAKFSVHPLPDWSVRAPFGEVVHGQEPTARNGMGNSQKMTSW